MVLLASLVQLDEYPLQFGHEEGVMKALHATLALLWGVAASAGAQEGVLLPQVRGPLPVSDASFPLLAANRTQESVDLAALGWVEEEYLVSGTANVYDWTESGGIGALATDAPYGTRVLLRRPADPARFNGTVVVELLNDARVYDWAFLWALSWQYFVEQGVAWVGITHTPQAAAALTTFDPVRYAGVGFPNPVPDELCGPQNTASPFEEGLQWDIFSQIGALLKSDSAGAPLAGFDVDYLYLTSHHGQAGTYANTLHRSAILASGKPVYDGYLLESSDTTMRLRRCGSAPTAGDPRQVVRNAGVPVIRIVPQGEALNAAGSRRDDSDAPADPFRQYEIAGAPRMDKLYFLHLPLIEDQLRAGQPVSNGKWPYDYTCTPDIDLLDFPIKRYIVNGAFANLDRWVRSGTPPPRAEPLAIRNAGSAEAAFETDQHGNVLGGVRHTYVDVPVARYAGSSPPRCGTIANRQSLGWTVLQQLYGGPDNYAAQVAASVESMRAQGWITDSDAVRLQEELETAGL